MIPVEGATVRGGRQTRAITITVLGGRECAGITSLRGADGTTRPLPTSGVAVADAILATSEGRFLVAVILRVSALVCVVTLAGAIADLAVVALDLGVSTVGVEGADTRRTCKCTGSAGTSATAVAAVAVYAVVGVTLIGSGASLAVGLLRRTDRAGTVVACYTISIRGTRAQAVERVSGTLVGRTTLSTRVETDSGTVALVS